VIHMPGITGRNVSFAMDGLNPQEPEAHLKRMWVMKPERTQRALWGAFWIVFGSLGCQLGRKQGSAAPPTGALYSEAGIYWASIDSLRAMTKGRFPDPSHIGVLAAIEWWPMNPELHAPLVGTPAALGPVPPWLVTMSRNHGTEITLVSVTAFNGKQRSTNENAIMVLGPILYLSASKAFLRIDVTLPGWQSEVLYTVWVVRQDDASWRVESIRQELQS
jgi:hypothetical protein